MSIIKKCKLKYASVAEWQTRTFKGRVRKSVGSSPTTCTIKVLGKERLFKTDFKFYSIGLIDDFYQNKISKH